MGASLLMLHPSQDECPSLRCSMPPLRSQNGYSSLRCSMPPLRSQDAYSSLRYSMPPLRSQSGALASLQHASASLSRWVLLASLQHTQMDVTHSATAAAASSLRCADVWLPLCYGSCHSLRAAVPMDGFHSTPEELAEVSVRSTLAALSVSV